jgi:hypothetical protein
MKITIKQTQTYEIEAESYNEALLKLSKHDRSYKTKDEQVIISDAYLSE